MFNVVENKGDIDVLVDLARQIWTEHYSPILESGQVAYMLENLHSNEVIEKQIAQENYHYFLIENGNRNIGYIGIQSNSDHLFLSKIYIALSERGQGIGKLSMDFIKAFAKKNNLNAIKLTVNKNNTNTIAAYYKMGFVKIREVCVDIGGGYFMDDLEMMLSIRKG